MPHESFQIAPVDSEGVWPVCFDGNDRETFLFQQTLRYVGTMCVEFVRSVTAITYEDNLGIPYRKNQLGKIHIDRDEDCAYQ